MAKKARQKRLKLVDKSPIGMSVEQADELRQLYKPLSHTGDFSLTRGAAELRKMGLDRLLHIYVEALCHDARMDSRGSTRRIASLRSKIVKDIEKIIGRECSPDDIVKGLAQHAPVPTYAKEAIRRDYLRISV